MSTSPSASGALSPTLSSSLRASISSIVPHNSELSPETDLLIGYVAKSISHNVVTQLEQASIITFQYTDDQAYMFGHTVLDVYDKILQQMRDRQRALQGRRTIIVDIAQFIEPDNALAEHLNRNNYALIPARLIQLSGEDIVTRVANSRFTDVFTMAVKSAFEQEMNSLGHTRVGHLFTRQKTMHQAENGRSLADPICFFKVMEQNYEFPFDKSKGDDGAVTKHKLCEFSIECDICKDVHSIKVVR